MKITAELIISNAKKEADYIIASARSGAKSIVVQAKLDAAEIVKETLEWVNEKEKIAKTTTFDKMNGRKDDDDDW